MKFPEIVSQIKMLTYRNMSRKVNPFSKLEEIFQFGKLFRFLLVHLYQKFEIWNKRI